MIWQIKWEDQALKQLRKIDKSKQKLIHKFIKDKIINSPRLFGTELTGNRKGYWRYRIGNYRLICDIVDREIVVLIIGVGHRKEIYD